MVAHASAFRAPDSFNEKETNTVFLLTETPFAEADLKKAVTLAEVFKAGFGGSCYFTTVSLPSEWEHTETPDGSLSGYVRIFGGHETTVFSKYKLFYDFTFKAALLKDFKKRR